jgi:hypothetical protein
MQIRSRGFRKLTTALMVAALCNLGSVGSVSTLAAGKKADTAQMNGQLIVSGNVTINDKKAINGTTVFNSSKIAVACAKGNSAIVNLGRLGRIELSPGSKFVVKFTEGVISGDLLEGKALVSTPTGTRVSINTPDGVTNNDGKEAAVVAVNSQRGVRCVPTVVSGSGNSSVSSLSPAAWTALLVGAGGAAAGVALAMTSDDNTSNASVVIP